jgi:hypothetical protein
VNIIIVEVRDRSKIDLAAEKLAAALCDTKGPGVMAENLELTRLLKAHGLTRQDVEPKKTAKEIEAEISACMARKTNQLDRIRCWFGDDE